MTKYEGTIILKETGRESTVEELQTLISAEIDTAGGKVGEFNAVGQKDFVRDRKSTRLNSIHTSSSDADFCLK